MTCLQNFVSRLRCFVSRMMFGAMALTRSVPLCGVRAWDREREDGEEEEEEELELETPDLEDRDERRDDADEDAREDDSGSNSSS